MSGRDLKSGAGWPAGSVGGLGWALISLGLTACSPALDWREVRAAPANLVALFPCRPVAQTRELVLGDQPVTMTLQACEAGGGTFAMAVVDVKDPAQVSAALVALRAASEAKQVAGAAPVAPATLAVDGATPQPASGRWLFQGQRDDGKPLPVDTALFARGTWVVQATVIGAVDAAIFFEGLRFEP